MDKEELLKLIQRVKDGKANQQDILEVFTQANLLLEEYNNLLDELSMELEKAKQNK